MHRNTVAHGHNPTHSNRLPNCDRLVAIVIFMRTHTTQYYLESRGQVAYMKLTLRANSDYGEKVHHSVKNFRQRLAIWGINWYGIQDGKYNNNKMPQVGVLQRSSFLSEGLRLPPEKLDLQRTPLTKKNICHVGNHVVFSFMLQTLHQRTFDHSVSPNWWRTHIVANHDTPFPPKLHSWLVHSFAMV